MIVKAQLAGIIAGESVQAEGRVELKDGATVKKFFKEADAAFGHAEPKLYFRESLKQKPPPVVLLNGERLELPADLKRRLKDGDAISVVVLVGGG